MNNKSPPFVSYAALPVASNVFTTLMPKSGLSTAIIFKSSVVGPAVPAGNPGVCWAAAGREARACEGEASRDGVCCSAGLPRDCATVGPISAQRVAKVRASKEREPITKRRYAFISILLASQLITVKQSESV